MTEKQYSWPSVSFGRLIWIVEVELPLVLVQVEDEFLVEVGLLVVLVQVEDEWLVEVGLPVVLVQVEDGDEVDVDDVVRVGVRVDVKVELLVALVRVELVAGIPVLRDGVVNVCMESEDNGTTAPSIEMRR